MAEATKVSPGDEATAVQQNDLVEDAQKMLLTDQDTATISSGALSIATVAALVTVAAESGTADDLDSMSASSGSFDTGDIIVLVADTGDTITITDGASANNFDLLEDEEILITDTSYAAFQRTSGGLWRLLFTNASPMVSIQIPLGGAGAAIPDGTYVDFRLRYDIEVQAVSALADQSGTIRVEFWVDDYANFPPTSADEVGSITLTTATKNEDTALSGFTDKTWTKGQVCRVYVDGVATSIEQVTVEIRGHRLV